jgi:hypothetical protein
VNAVINLRFHKMRVISWLTEDLLASQEGLCYVELVSEIKEAQARRQCKIANNKYFSGTHFHKSGAVYL